MYVYLVSALWHIERIDRFISATQYVGIVHPKIVLKLHEGLCSVEHQKKIF